MGLRERGGGAPERLRETERARVPAYDAAEPFANSGGVAVGHSDAMRGRLRGSEGGGIIKSRSGAAAARRAHNPKVVGSNPTSATPDPLAQPRDREHVGEVVR